VSVRVCISARGTRVEKASGTREWSELSSDGTHARV